MCFLSLIAELFWPHPLDTPAAAADASPLQSVNTVPWQPAARPEYQLIADRPIFTVDRRPFVPPPETPVEVAAPPQSVQFALSAIMSSSGKQVALLKTNTSNETIKLQLNESAEGWMLVEVRADSVVLRQGANTVTVELQPERGVVERTGLSATSPVARGE
jgi:hypothetical protein